MQQNIKLQCPSCAAQVVWNDDFPHRPFCSKRCKLIDFGEWADEKHRIEGEPAIPEEAEHLDINTADYLDS